MPGVAVAVAALKPFVLVWAGLKAFEDIALVIRVGRLGWSVLPFPPGKQPNPKEMCSVCDDVMDDLLGIDNLNVIPCRAACFGLKRCVHMCEKLQKASEESNDFPCIAAGFCDPIEDEDDAANIAVPTCKTGAFFSCTPSRYCRKKRKGMKVTCELKPGISSWLGLKSAMAGDHAGALASGLAFQANCGEPGAGPYCIARPKGVGLIAEYIGHFISIVVGTQKSIAAIESMGGSDDRQWLTFWVILTNLLFIERFFARVILSNFSYYYHVKLLVLVWLVWRNGADTCYRKLRRFLETRNMISSDEEEAIRGLKRMKRIGKFVVKKRLTWLVRKTKSKWKMNDDWGYDHEDDDLSRHLTDPNSQLYELSKFILSAEGVQKLGECKDVSIQDKMLLVEHAASVVSFQPRFLRVHVVGTVDGPMGQLQAMCSGLADPYAVCRIVSASGKTYPKHGVATSILHNTLNPRWNQELEIPFCGGFIDSDGFYHCEDDIDRTKLQVIVRDADVGFWKKCYHIFRFLAAALAIDAVVARIDGLQHAELSAAVVVFPCFVISYVMAVSMKRDYETIGQCIVPLGMLMDQRTHALKLTLRMPDDENKMTKEKQSTNSSSDSRGVLRVRLMLSER